MNAFQELIRSEQPVLVDFYADWCGPCKAMAPIVKEVAQATSGAARVVKIDIDKNAAVSQSYRIQAVPTFVIFKKGAVVWRHSGMIDKNSLVNVLMQHA